LKSFERSVCSKNLRLGYYRSLPCRFGCSAKDVDFKQVVKCADFYLSFAEMAWVFGKHKGEGMGEGKISPKILHSRKS
jgi:hypothetical protein